AYIDPTGLDPYSSPNYKKDPSGGLRAAKPAPSVKAVVVEAVNAVSGAAGTIAGAFGEATAAAAKTAHDVGNFLHKYSSGGAAGNMDRELNKAGDALIAQAGKMKSSAGALAAVEKVGTAVGVGLTTLNVAQSIKQGDITGAEASVVGLGAGMAASTVAGAATAPLGPEVAGPASALAGIGAGYLASEQVKAMQGIYTMKASEMEAAYGEKLRSGKMGALDYLGLAGLSGGLG